MRQASKPPSEQISDLRLARLLFWARLWLERWAFLLELQIFAPAFGIIERALGAIIILRAAAIAEKPQRRTGHHPHAAPDGFQRRLARGSDLHLALGDVIKRTRHRDPRRRIAALRALIANIDKAIARVARRMARGLGRARLVAIRPPALALATNASAPDAPCADTS